MKTLIPIFLALTVFTSCKNASEKFTHLHHVPQTQNIVIDGEIDEWKNQGLRIPLVSDRLGTSNPESFFALVSLAWDHQYLYLMAQVADDSLHQDNGGPIWRNDGLEIFLSARKGTREMIQYLVAPALTAEFPEPRIEKQDFRSSQRILDMPDLLIAHQITGSGYNLEIGIPFSSLGINPNTGDTLAFNFYVNDSDGPRQFGKYSWHYNDNTYLNHDALHNIILSDKELNHNVLTRAWLLDTAVYHVNLFSKIPVKDQIKLVNAGELLAEIGFSENEMAYAATHSFHKNKITDPAQPLDIYFGNTYITSLNWLDMTRQYVNIPPPNNFENEILLFEKADTRNFHPKGATLFVGSSSIRLWTTLAEDLPGITYINRGFGGSRTDDVLHFFDRIVAPYNPSTIVYFTGTNDLASGRTPEETVYNTEAFIKRVNEVFPYKPRILILSNTIAVSRKHLYKKYHEANRLLQGMLDNYDNAVYVDVTTPGLRPDGQPRGEIYTSDSLHLNRLGYEMWGKVVYPYLKRE
jgi:lysophospholipase L1-like esterase